MEKRPKIIRTLIVASLFSLIMFSCSDKTNNPVVENGKGDYDLIYGPVPRTDPFKYYAFTYSTKTGERIDTGYGSNLLYYDLLFNAGGTLAAFSGRSQDLHPGPKFTWVTSYPGGDTIAIKEGVGGKKLFLNRDETNLLLIGSQGFTILAFPSLDSIYQDTVGQMGGFLTLPGHMYYLDSLKDTIFTIDYSSSDSVRISKSPIDIEDSIGPIVATGVDYSSRLLYILLADISADKSTLNVYNSDSLNLLKRLTMPLYFRGLSIFAGHDECYLFRSGLARTYVNYVCKYSYLQNKVSSFLENIDVQTPDPFLPHQIEFTPDGNEIYILSGGDMYKTPVMGIRLLDKVMTNYIVYDSGTINTFKINPVNWADRR